MKKFLFLALIAFSALTHASDIWNKEQKWKMPTKSTTMTVTVIGVKNVQATCEAESKKRGNGGFGYGVQACTFWQGNNCTLFLEQSETHHTLGHEFYHCFKGNFH